MGALGELSWWRVLVAALIGLAGMALLGFVLEPALSSATEGAFLAMAVGVGGVCTFGAGFAAGAWTNWKGSAHGLFVGFLVWLGNVVCTSALATVHQIPAHLGLYAPGLLIAFLVLAGVGALGGAVGERVRR